MMTAAVKGANCQWLCAGQEIFPAMMSAMEAATKSICLETYIYSSSGVGLRFRDLLVSALRRQVRVQVLIDALGSFGLSAEFWKPLLQAGGEIRWFNPLSLNRLGFRDHRKLLVCDEAVAFVGGFNIAPEYEGDGVTSGWCDLGLRIEGPLVAQLSASFSDMFARAGFRHKRFARLMRSSANRTISAYQEQLLLSGPARGHSPIKRALKKDIERARSVQIMVAYFLPSWQLRRQLARVVQRGGRVRLILASKSDVAVSRLATQSLYRRLLKAGIQIHEYQPQVLHAKLIIIDEIVYVGSANLDPRSLNINYELMIRFVSPEIARLARAVFSRCLGHTHLISHEQWMKEDSIWRRFKAHWAYFLLVRIDPYVAQWQWRALPD